MNKKISRIIGLVMVVIAIAFVVFALDLSVKAVRKRRESERIAWLRVLPQ